MRAREERDLAIGVDKVSYPVPLADDHNCTHGLPVRYNLAVGVILHPDGSRCDGDLGPAGRDGYREEWRPE